MIHNTQDLENLSEHGRQKKIIDANEFYIPMGRIVAPLMVKELEQNIKHYLIKAASQG
jgi:hypothetical protein